MELCQTDAGRTYSREKCNRNGLGRRATVRSDDQKEVGRGKERLTMPQEVYRALRRCRKALGREE